MCMPDICTSEDVSKNFEFLFKNGEQEFIIYITVLVSSILRQLHCLTNIF